MTEGTRVMVINRAHERRQQIGVVVMARGREVLVRFVDGEVALFRETDLQVLA